MKRTSFQRGMTLVEILASMIILSILALITLRYMGVSLTASGNAIAQARDAETVVSVMERITVDYRRLLEHDSTPLASLKTAIGAEGTRHANTYGNYEVLINTFISFDASNHEIPDTTLLNVLKVKVQVGDRRLVSMFTN